MLVETIQQWMFGLEWEKSHSNVATAYFDKVDHKTSMLLVTTWLYISLSDRKEE